jgi:hypothetical protein
MQCGTPDSIEFDYRNSASPTTGLQESTVKGNFGHDEVSRLIHESYQQQIVVIDPSTQCADSSCSSVIYKDEKLFD